MMRKSKVTETNSSDDVVYSIDSDLSDIDMDNNVERDIPNIQQQESWSGKKLTSNMPYYEGESELSNDFESKIPRNPSSRLVELDLVKDVPAGSSKENRCKVDSTAPQIINQYNKFMGRIDTMDTLVALHPISFKIETMIIMNSHRRDSNSYNSTSHRSIRLFHFKSKIAKFLFKKTKHSPSRTSFADGSHRDEENQPPPKKLCDAESRVAKAI
ncbi:unnamed protein product, partial [Rotaria magnacalcarata]